MKKLFKLLSLLRLFGELRYTLRGRHGHRGYGSHGAHWHPRSRGYHPLYRRPGKLKMKHLVRDLIAGRRY